MAKCKTQRIGILTAGGDCPGLNSAIRGIAKAAMHYGIHVVGIKDGFRGLVFDNMVDLTEADVSGILTSGGTILGSCRDKPHKMRIDGKKQDMTGEAVENLKRNQIDCLVCLGGNGTQKNAKRLVDAGANVITLPKTIDNDVWNTDITFGFDSALNIATEAIDRLHTTATSHHRIILCEIMGHDAGWLALGAGVAGGADVILIPEIPYDLEVVAKHLQDRRRKGKRASIIAVAEGVRSIEEAAREETEMKANGGKKKKKAARKPERSPEGHILVPEPIVSRIARELTTLTEFDARVTSLGHVQRGGTPTATDRLLCTRLGTRVGDLLVEGRYNVMVAVKGSACKPVPLEDVAGKIRLVDPADPMIQTARYVETSFGSQTIG